MNQYDLSIDRIYQPDFSRYLFDQEIAYKVFRYAFRVPWLYSFSFTWLLTIYSGFSAFHR